MHISNLDFIVYNLQIVTLMLKIWITVLQVWIWGLFNDKIGSRLQIALFVVVSKFPTPLPRLFDFT